MQMLILQVILWLLFALLAGLIVGWLVRPFYCKDCVTNDGSSKFSGGLRDGLSGGMSGGLSGNATNTEDYSTDKNTRSSTATKVAAAAGAATTAVASKLVDSESSDYDTQKTNASAPMVVEDLDLNAPELDVEINLDNPELLADLEMELGLNADELDNSELGVDESDSEGQVAITEDMKPTLLTGPRSGSKRGDDLKRVKGIGKVLERRLKELGIYHYDQIAELSDDQVLWITDYISFPAGRIKDEQWVAQALALAEGEATEYSSRFDNGDTPYK